MHLTEHIKETVFFVILKKEVQIYRQTPNIFVMVQNLQEEGLAVGLEEAQRIFDNFDLFGSLKKFHCTQIYLM